MSGSARRIARPSMPSGRRGSTPVTPDDGAPGPRRSTAPTTTAGSCWTRTATASRRSTPPRRPVPDGCVDHLWLRVRDPQASRRFYTTIAPYAGLRLAHDAPDRVQFSGADFSFSLARDERPLTEHVHLAFSADGDATCGPSTPPRSRRDTRITAPRRARHLPPGLLRRVRPRPRRPQRRGRQPQRTRFSRTVTSGAQRRCARLIDGARHSTTSVAFMPFFSCSGIEQNSV